MMFQRPDILMIGATGRNTGKTTFACEVIRRYSGRHAVVGANAKVTTIADRRGPCPRGGQGCGVCSSLAGDYQITEERAEAGGKDTQRMLAAGAHRAYWLRVCIIYQNENRDPFLSMSRPMRSVFNWAHRASTHPILRKLYHARFFLY